MIFNSALFIRFEEAEGKCAVERDCSDLPDGRYPLCQQECRWFYTCSAGQSLGLTYCGDGKELTGKVEILQDATPL